MENAPKPAPRETLEKFGTDLERIKQTTKTLHELGAELSTKDKRLLHCVLVDHLSITASLLVLAETLTASIERAFWEGGKEGIGQQLKTTRSEAKGTLNGGS